MSCSLLKTVQDFLKNRTDPLIFSDEFIRNRKEERDKGILLLDSQQLSEALSSIFCLADLFNPDEARESYELSEDAFRAEVRKILKLACL